MTQPYLKPLIRNYEENRDPVRASQMKKYMKDQFDFYGIATPDRRAMMKAHIKEYGLPDWSKIEEISRSLWEADERECQFTLLDLMNRMKKKNSVRIICHFWNILSQQNHGGIQWMVLPDGL